MPSAAYTSLAFIKLAVPRLFTKAVPQIGLFSSSITQNVIFCLGLMRAFAASFIFNCHLSPGALSTQAPLLRLGQNSSHVDRKWLSERCVHGRCLCRASRPATAMQPAKTRPLQHHHPVFCTMGRSLVLGSDRAAAVNPNTG